MCGAERRRRIAARIDYGVEQYGGAGWFVGTFATDVTKREAVKTQAKFVRWLREYLGYKVEYAATWELTRQGRLHLNLVLGPWTYVPQRMLEERWQRFGGGRVWIELVGAGIGAEAAKSRARVSAYFAKFEQMVREGRGIAYSKGWPELPAGPAAHRRGKIAWSWWDGQAGLVRIFEMERDKGYWHEVAPGEWAIVFGEKCDCFEIAVAEPRPPDKKETIYTVKNESVTRL